MLYQQLLLSIVNNNENKNQNLSEKNHVLKMPTLFFASLSYESVFLKCLEEVGKCCIAFPAIRIQVRLPPLTSRGENETWNKEEEETQLKQLIWSFEEEESERTREKEAIQRILTLEFIRNLL